MSENKSRIPIKNIYYMLCYAWDVLDIKNDILVDEDDFNDAYDLLSRIFAYGVGKLIRSGFHKSYVDKQEELSTLKGKAVVAIIAPNVTLTEPTIQRVSLAFISLPLAGLMLLVLKS